MKEIITIKSRFLYGTFDQNTYVLIDGKNAVIVDAGAELEDVLKLVKNKKVLAILLTHVHFDHIWNIENYVKEFSCPVYICEGAEDKLTSPDKNQSTMIKRPVVCEIDHKNIKYYAKKLNIGSFDFEVLFTPAHSSDSICLIWDKNLFTGDTIFSDGIGRTDFYDSDPQNMINNFKIILSLDFDTAYPGHGGQATKGKIVQIIKYYL